MYVLKVLYRGNIIPTERPVRLGSDYKKASAEICEQLNHFWETLTPEGRKQLEVIDNLRSDMAFMAEEEAFIYGFRLGAKMIMDVVGEYKGQFMEVGE